MTNALQAPWSLDGQAVRGHRMGGVGQIADEWRYLFLAVDVPRA